MVTGLGVVAEDLKADQIVRVTSYDIIINQIERTCIYYLLLFVMSNQFFKKGYFELDVSRDLQEFYWRGNNNCSVLRAEM